MAKAKRIKQRRSADIRRRHAEKRNQRSAGRSKRQLSPRSMEESLASLPKMSDIILAFAEPLLCAAETEQEMRSALSFSVTAWNASFLPGDAWRQPFERVGAGNLGPPDDWQDFEQTMAEMVDLRRAVFAHEDRMIVNYELTFDRRGNRRLLVASTPVEPRAALPVRVATSPKARERQLDLDMMSG